MIHPSVIKKQRVILFILVCLIIMTIMIGMSTGFSSIAFDRILPILTGHGTFKENFVLFSIRLPRIIITILSGMALAVSGAILQGLTRNDLADPGIIGINSGAGVGIAIFYLFVPIEAHYFAYVLPAVAFIGALLTAIFIYIFSYNKKVGFEPVKLVIVGIGFAMALSGAMILFISGAERQKVDFISKWLSGNIWGTDWPFIWAILPWILILIPFTLYKSNRLNILALSEQSAIGVGLNLKKERFILLLAAVALAASAVSVTGGIAFIGLLAPHIAKSLIGPRSQLYMPVVILMGGWILLLSDTIGRNLADPDGIPAGIITALIGAPYFVYLLMREKRV
ncbi:iron ABC transporter permease [Bacillus sp. FJAT-49736]|uniref:FecCD family ABC transporter permease n=1 Tax=Bacillus sp. FJAT-49736 TaxID=2833582 RepID=UPI001BC8F7BD|nr:iron ABC transporter permease [Bacillus sp. FJAT-49736]MBS4174126.1 iron ABC transporter permease [Bacillus sp. FJAT-49736]